MDKGGLEARFVDIARASLHTGMPRFARFLDPQEVKLAAHAANQVGARYQVHGGYEGAERCVVGFVASGEIDEWEWPIKCLRLSWNEQYGSAAHRDLLGALMAQGIDRACTGDIVVAQGCAYLFVLPEVLGYLKDNLESAGRVKLKCEEVALNEVQMEAPKGQAFRVTVSSMRLDAVVAEGYNLSRAQAQNLITRALVKLNHQEQIKTDARVSEGDLVSVRGHGRLKITEELGETKKGRFALQLFKYGEP